MFDQTDLSALFQGFSKLSREERFQRLMMMGALSQVDVDFLESGAVQDVHLADKFIENSIGYFQLPLGVASYFRVDGRDYVIPLAVEETSIIAALSKTAKWVREQGDITTSVAGNGIIGQIQFATLNNVPHFQQIFASQREAWIQQVNQDVLSGMVKRGGGVLDMIFRCLPRADGQTMGVIHLTMDSCDAMGANAINQVLEYLKEPIEASTGEKVTMCILSNLNDQKLTTAVVRLSGIDPSLAERLQEASLFAETDPYRAATHNKGILNGIDAVAIATGNDWRAIEAGMHAYAARSGCYRPLSQWRYQDGTLVGTLTAPIIVGTVGGVTSLHPTARLCLSMLNVSSANELSRVMAAVGLVQNLGALRALCTEGIIKGHMKLHIDNIILVSGATERERPLLKAHLTDYLQHTKRVSLSHAHQFLTKLRQVESV
ncbi:MAG: hydroxymethylglutaryl-CoA reductase, degradative [Gammaproteobacteria bacterium]|nr:hydroxymethylglutaryl-CoA reductase, degradative [Gammaproteobacteria bacterium]